jgi:hypothetical protein
LELGIATRDSWAHFASQINFIYLLLLVVRRIRQVGRRGPRGDAENSRHKSDLRATSHWTAGKWSPTCEPFTVIRKDPAAEFPRVRLKSGFE